MFCLKKDLAEDFEDFHLVSVVEAQSFFLDESWSFSNIQMHEVVQTAFGISWPLYGSCIVKIPCLNFIKACSAYLYFDVLFRTYMEQKGFYMLCLM